MKKVSFMFSSMMILVLALFSCNKNDDEPVGIYLPKKISGMQNGEQWTVTFNYDHQNRLVSAIPKYNGSVEYVMGIIYQDQSKYEIKFFDEGKNTPYMIYFAEEIDDEIEVKIVRYDNEGEEYAIFEYDYVVEDGRISCFHYDYFQEEFFYDAEGNMILREWTEMFSPEPVISTYEYDNRNGIYSNIKTPAWILWDILYIDQLDEPWFFVNNVTKCNIGVFEVRYEYSYNAEGYPLTIKVTNNYYGMENTTDVKIEYK